MRKIGLDRTKWLSESVVASVRYWAEICFTALGGRTADFLQHAASRSFKLRKIRPQLGGISANCAAKSYFSLAKLAKRYHVKLQVKSRRGMYFRVKFLLACKGMWCGVILFLTLLTGNRNLIWEIEGSSLTEGQTARVTEILWESCRIAPGAYSSEALLAQGETALLSYSDEFSWVSLNFTGGRLTIEVAAAVAVPEIAEGDTGDLIATEAGTVVRVNVQQGTAMVTAGDVVNRGQILISSARLEHDQKTLVYEPTAGQVLAHFKVHDTEYMEMVQQVELAAVPIGIQSTYEFYFCGRIFSLSKEIQNSVVPSKNDAYVAKTTTRMTPLSWLGFSFPITIFETNSVYYEQAQLIYSAHELIDCARVACETRLYDRYPDATVVGRAETITENDGCICYQIEYELIVDICSSTE